MAVRRSRLMRPPSTTSPDASIRLQIERVNVLSNYSINLMLIS